MIEHISILCQRCQSKTKIHLWLNYQFVRKIDVIHNYHIQSV